MNANRGAAATARLLAGVAVVVAAACGPAVSPAPRVPPATPRLQTPATIRVRSGNRIVTVPFEEYVAATALSEVTPVGESAATVARIYEVQTIVARTYALAHLGRHHADGFDLCDSTHCQLYEPSRLKTSRFAADARRAAMATRGQVLTYEASPIDALFHADCGGHTTSPEQVWGTPAVPYLRPEPDDVPDVSHRTWRSVVTLDQVRRALSGDARWSPGRSIKTLMIDAKDPTGRVAHIIVTGDRRVSMRGEDFRAAVNRALGPKTIQSTMFSLSRHGGSIEFTGAGFGHGVGLCQVGALARARRGEATAAILADYFPGVRLTQASAKLP